MLVTPDLQLQVAWEFSHYVGAVPGPVEVSSLDGATLSGVPGLPAVAPEANISRVFGNFYFA